LKADASHGHVLLLPRAWGRQAHWATWIARIIHAQIAHDAVATGMSDPRAITRRRCGGRPEDALRSINNPGQGLVRIAVFHMNQVGDFIFSLPALAGMRARFPGADITSILRPHLIELAELTPAVDRVIPYPLGLIGEVRLARTLLNRSFDLVLAFPTAAPTALQALLTRARVRVGFADAGLGFCLTDRALVRGTASPWKLAQLAAVAGAEIPQPRYVGLLQLSPALRQRGQRLLAARGVEPDARVAAIAPGASRGREYKAWQVRGFAAVAQHLRHRWGATVAVVGGVADVTTAMHIARSMSTPCINLAGQTTTGELAAILERADLLVGIDSGPMHVAAAMRTPVVALFGPTDPRIVGPQGEGHEVVTAGLDCSPCPQPCASRRCMSLISEDQVIAAADRILGRTC
jgi:lipopolysaccharide heptosyltransferase II